MDGATTFQMRRCLESLLLNDPNSQRDLQEYTVGRMRVLVERMYSRLPRLRHYEEIDDLLYQRAQTISETLRRTKPTDLASFLELMASQMRRSLEVLARDELSFGADQELSDPELRSTKSIIDGAVTLVDSRNSNSECSLSWSKFHTAADRLPSRERIVFYLLYYHEMSRIEAADLIGISQAELNQCWLASRRMILREMDQSCPQTD